MGSGGEQTEARHLKAALPLRILASVSVLATRPLQRGRRDQESAVCCVCAAACQAVVIQALFVLHSPNWPVNDVVRQAFCRKCSASRGRLPGSQSNSQSGLPRGTESIGQSLPTFLFLFLPRCKSARFLLPSCLMSRKHNDGTIFQAAAGRVESLNTSIPWLVCGPSSGSFPIRAFFLISALHGCGGGESFRIAAAQTWGAPPVVEWNLGSGLGSASGGRASLYVKRKQLSPSARRPSFLSPGQ